MQVEDKQLQSADLDRDELKQRQRGLEQEEDAELRQLAGEEVIDAGKDHAGKVLAAMEAILDQRSVTVSSLQLPQREAKALEYLQSAVGGTRTNQGTYVFASDRRDLLEQALAVLQPNLTGMDPAKLAELGNFHNLIERVGELRSELSMLEDAQDDLLDARLELPDLTKESPDGSESIDAPKPPSSLSNGPDRPPQQPEKSALSEGPAVKKPDQPSTLYGDK